MRLLARLMKWRSSEWHDHLFLDTGWAMRRYINGRWERRQMTPEEEKDRTHLIAWWRRQKAV